jgi:hypothetical protein
MLKSVIPGKRTDRVIPRMRGNDEYRCFVIYCADTPHRRAVQSACGLTAMPSKLKPKTIN